MAARDLAEVEVDAFLAKAELIAQLTAHPSWPAWEDLLRTFRQSALEELTRVTDPSEFRYWQGVASALGEIVDRPGRIVASAAEILKAEEADKKGIRPELRAVVGMGFDDDGAI